VGLIAAARTPFSPRSRLPVIRPGHRAHFDPRFQFLRGNGGSAEVSFLPDAGTSLALTIGRSRTLTVARNAAGGLDSNGSTAYGSGSGAVLPSGAAIVVLSGNNVVFLDARRGKEGSVCGSL
jgi:hypothetical protein